MKVTHHHHGDQKGIKSHGDTGWVRQLWSPRGPNPRNRLFSSTSSWLWGIASNGDFTAFLGNLSKCLAPCALIVSCFSCPLPIFYHWIINGKIISVYSHFLCNLLWRQWMKLPFRAARSQRCACFHIVITCQSQLFCSLDDIGSIQH